MGQTPMISMTVDLTDAQQANALRAFMDAFHGAGKPVMTTTHVAGTSEKTVVKNTRQPVTKTADPEPEQAEESTTTSDEVTLDELTARVRQINEGNPSFAKELKGLLKPYGAERVSLLDPSDYLPFYNDIAKY